MHPALRSLATIVWLAVAQPAAAEESLALAVGYDAAILAFSHYAADGQRRAREESQLNGVEFALDSHGEIYYWGWEGRYLEGDGQYEGHTEIGQPLAGTSAQWLADAALKIGRRYQAWKHYDYALIYLAGGFRYRQRTIAVTGEPSFQERYQVPYAMLGAEGFLWHALDWRVLVRLNVMRTILPRAQVTLEGYDAVDVDMSGRYGMRLSLPVRYYFSRALVISATPALEMVEFSETQPVALFQDGRPAGAYQKPRAVAEQWQFTLGLRYRW